VKWQPTDGEEVLLAFIRRADEGTLSRLLVETTILMRLRGLTAKVDTEAIGQKVKQEFAAKDRVRKEVKPVPKSKKAA